MSRFNRIMAAGGSCWPAMGGSVQIDCEEAEQQPFIERIRLDGSDVYVTGPSLVIAAEVDRGEGSILGGWVIIRGHSYLNKSATAKALDVRTSKQVVPLPKAR